MAPFRWFPQLLRRWSMISFRQHPVSTRTAQAPGRKAWRRQEARTRLDIEWLEDRRLLSNGFRTFDGSGNNLAHPDWGQAGIDELRKAPVAYADGISAPARPDNPSPRFISN